MKERILKNPFVVGKYAGPAYFCDREKEKQQLYHHVENGRNVLLVSERRLGKSGLIEHCFANTPIQDEYYAFFIDIYALHNLRELVYQLAQEVFNRITPRQKNFALQFTSFLRSIKTSFSYDSMSGTPSISLSMGEISQPEVTLDEIFSCLEHADKPCIVAIDEFQQITRFDEQNMEALLRTKIQHLKNVSFIFAGSQSHLLSQLFNTPSRPFYNSVVFMQLNPIPEEAYRIFVRQQFGAYGKRVTDGLTARVYSYFKGITWYLQLFMNEVFAYTGNGETATEELFDEVLQHLVNVQQFTYEDMYSRFTEKQKSVLLALAREYPRPVTPTSKEFIRKYHLQTASMVQTALKALTEKGIVGEYGGSRQISDLLFAEWLKHI